MNLTKFNIFNPLGKWYAYRWLITAVFIAAAMMAYFDYTGDGLFMNSSASQQWNSSGPGYHK